MFKPVQPVRAYERVVEQIEAALKSGELKAGEHLPSERELMRQFEVSRSTIREALRVLESSGRVRMRPGDPLGAQLLRLGAETLRRPLSNLAASDFVSFEDLLQFRVLLDGATTYLASELHTPEQLAHMETTLENLHRSVEAGHSAWSEADFAFHDAIAQASGNPLLQICSEVVRSVAVSMIEQRVAETPDSDKLLRHWAGLHQDMFDLIKSGRAAEASHRAQQDLVDQYGGHLPADRSKMLHDWIGSDPEVISAP